MGTYYISFDTREMEGAIKAVKVVLTHDIIRDMGRELNVALAADPLYRELERFVLSNPSRKA